MTFRPAFRAWRPATLAAWTVLLTALPAPARANAAMGLALGIFPFGVWLPYVAATVLFEAWAFSRARQIPARSALIRSCAANLTTALIGTAVTEVFFHGLVIVGSPLNPNPLAQSVVLFAGFGIVSAVIETPFWEGAGRRGASVLLASLAIHLAAVPLGLAVLLLPDRPYAAMENRVNASRGMASRRVALALTDHIRRFHRLPPVRSYGELLEFLRPALGPEGKDPDLWAAEAPAEYGRFSVGEPRHAVWTEWNGAARVDPDSVDPVWLARIRRNGHVQGIYLLGEFAFFTRDPGLLGFPAAEAGAAGGQTAAPTKATR